MNATAADSPPPPHGLSIRGANGPANLARACTTLGDSSLDALFRCGHDCRLSGHAWPFVLNGTARIARAAQTEVVSNKTKLQSLANVKPGDILVSHPTAVREHEISVIPNAPHAISPTHNAAVGDGRSEADARGVDAWLTEDHTHVVKIASHRAPDK